MDQIHISTEEYLILKVKEIKLRTILDIIFEKSELSYDKKHLRLNETDDLMTYLKITEGTKYYFKLKELKEEKSNGDSSVIDR